MEAKSQLDAAQLKKIRDDILDSIDEELEMAIEDGGNENNLFATEEEKKSRAIYFRELLRLQGELVKLQDWVVASKQKVVMDVMPQEKGALSSALPKDLIHVFAG